ncbi:TadA family conjugal transfer-associated ATPase [Aeromicrobium sp. IC_218]|uniref:TadA family conjugal transfer-associated ATPase n=1 Tax=Aeromicrobium sp. IC_218 TaxID=2545468 RepID=UPI00103EE056|nr:TadA family conjugal transfer-associated ATPase [Aeromicrobium sp. IC_218]TCI96862.1 TadA family conjugal transfer-associated ATPase [Aeromicrobium sp. IC_218]
MTGGLPAAVVDRVRERLAARALEPTAESVAEVLRDERRLVGDGTVLALADQLRQESLGAGPLEPLLRRRGVTDVLVNQPGEAYVDAGSGLERVPVALPDEPAVRRLAQRLAALGGRRLDDASPYVDCRLPDGTRFHAVLAPVARPGTTLSLRVPARTAFTIDDLRAGGSLTEPGERVVRALVEQRLAFLVSGGTGSGKTTLLATLLGLVPPSERLVLVEDATELRPAHPHVVGLEARPANVEGAGEVAVRDLVRQALRMRPDRLVVGEVRGAEVVDLLAALNTGHEGGAGTLHANASADVPARLEALALAAGLPREALHAQLASAVDAVLHVGRDPDGRRRLQEVAVLRRDRDGLVQACPALSFGPGGEPEHGPGWPWLEERLRWL